MKVIVSDSSPLIALLNINQFELLALVFDQIIIPTTVAKEIGRGERAGSDWFTIEKSKFISIKSIPKNDPRLALLELQLDRGESEAILLADKLNASLLIDERAGRNMAKTMGLEIIGLVGVLYALKMDGHITPDEMQALVSDLDKVHFRMSDDLKVLLLK